MFNSWPEKLIGCLFAFALLTLSVFMWCMIFKLATM